MWKGRAIAFVEALMKILVVMRDAEYVLLDSGDYNYFYLLKDSLNWIKRDSDNKPVMFFRYTNSVDSLVF